MLALVPSPPSAKSPSRVYTKQAPTGSTSTALVPAALYIPHQHGILAKGVVIDPSKVLTLTREETVTRKDIAAIEEAERRDVVFLIAHARSEYRRLAAARLSKPEAQQQALQLERLLFDPRSPPRQPKAVLETRKAAIALRPLPTKHADFFQEETELRDWIVRLEDRLRSEIATEYNRDVVLAQERDSVAHAEHRDRKDLAAAEHDTWKFIIRREFVERPPFVPPPPPRELTFEESETAARATLMEEEMASRKECHDWLCLRYGVRLFSVARTEDIYRCEIIEEFDESFTAAVMGFYHATYRCAMLAMCAAQAGGATRSLVSEVALMTKGVDAKRSKS